MNRPRITERPSTPRRRWAPTAVGLALCAPCVACAPNEEPLGGVTTDAGATMDAGSAPPAEGGLPGAEVVVDVAARDRTLVDLGDARVVEAGNGDDSTEWDLAFVGWDIFTNSGPSGPGLGQSFGPFDELNFLFGDEPAVPFLRGDRTGGAFEGWYRYDGGQSGLLSQLDVYGVRQGSRLWKVQLLSYYGDFMGTLISGIYAVRYAEVSENGAGETRVVSVDATAGGPRGTEENPSGCLDLESGQVLQLLAGDARSSSEWHLCFRRDSISVNGGAGGPGGVSAARVTRLDRSVEQLRETTGEMEEAAFDDVGYAALTDARLEYELDRVRSSFTDLWYSGAEPVEGAWLVVGADGASKYLMVFTGVSGATSASPGTLTLQVRPVEAAQ